MPNWVKNVVKISEETMNKIREKYFTNGELDFNKIIPMPKSLELTSGSITEMAIFYAFTQKDEIGKKEIVELLKNTSEFTYDNYWEKIKQYSHLGHFKDIEEEAKTYIPNAVERELNIKTLEELGDTYINNLKQYGSTTWYDWCPDHWGTKWGASKCQSDNNTIIFQTAWATPEPIFEKLSEEFPHDIFKIEYADEFYSNNNGILFYQYGVCYNSTELDENFAAEIWNREIKNSNSDKDITDDLFD